ncbi:MAG: peptidoglycan DD-metalloendopeptidase family protein [Hyphomicrobiales bacterium]|nr:peptidoglycan DD-metalloendopeptidase family protein [Hyphomicrobiales bacterium]OQW85185.1 MAG: hypothetical protein BVN31_01500 [Proteobacteria bacterium ST_bin15]
MEFALPKRTRYGPVAARLAAGVGLCLWLWQAPSGVMAQPSAERLESERQQRAGELEEINARLSLDGATLRRFEDEIDALKRDRQELARQAVLAASAVQQAESDISAGETRMGELARQEIAARGVLAGKQDIIAELLAALQKMSRNPPPAILVAPESALQTVRSAIVLGAVLPELRGELDVVLKDLEQVRSIRTAIATEISIRQRQLFTLGETRTRLDLLTEEKKRQLASSEQNVRLSRQRIEELARDAQNTRDLLSRLDSALDIAQKADAAAKAAAASAAASAPADNVDVNRDGTPRAGDRRVAALPSAKLPQPGPAFEQIKGQVTLPASGQILRRYGDDDGIGGTSRGVFLRTRAGATVTSPAEGWIVYAGSFRSYGQIVIVNVGGGHHILLAGMEKITVEPGQFVLAGESLAQMGQTILATAAALDLDSSRPVLYIEFRKDGVTVDPGPWWATNSEKARG